MTQKGLLQIVQHPVFKGFHRAHIASHGGPQSNAMVALAALARQHNSTCTYFCRPLPRWLRQHPSGNYARARALGIEIVTLRNYGERFRTTGLLEGFFVGEESTSPCVRSSAGRLDRTPGCGTFV